MDFTTISTIFSTTVVPIIAIVGLGISLYNTYRHWKETKPNISLELVYSDYFHNPPFEYSPYTGYVLIVKNLGKVDLIIDSTGFIWKKSKFSLNKEIFERNSYGVIDLEEYERFPYKLIPGSTFYLEFTLSEIIEEIEKTGLHLPITIRAFIKDGYRKYYSSSPFEINLEKGKI
jgi:hypothetical protein